LFQILTELKKLEYINVKQYSMIEQKITKRNVDMVNQREDFDFIHGHS